MKPILLKGIDVYTENDVLKNGYIICREYIIHQVGGLEELRNEEELEVLTFTNKHKALPGFIDIHIHGAAGADVMDATLQSLTTMAHALPKEGTTSFLATTMTQSNSSIEAALMNVATFIKKEQQPAQAEILGIHLEGPFVNPTKAGAQPVSYMKDPNVEIFKKWQALADDQIKLVTLAPELPGGLELIRYLTDQQIVSSIGHSDASYEVVQQAISMGASQVTHLYNQMRGLHHREPGVVGATFLHDELKAELIVDGIHVHPAMVKLAYKQKTAEGLMLITDAMRAKCLNEGKYELGGQDVWVRDGQATLEDGTLAGSILQLRDAVQNMMTFTDCTLEEIVMMTAVNPAKQLGVFDRKGSIEVGKDADIIILNENNEVVLTLCRGRVAFTKDEMK